MSVELAKRAVACKGFRWMAGMLIADHGAGIRFCWQEDGVLHGAANEGGAWMRVRADRALPDLDDPATQGCILALVREACGCRDLHPVQFTGSLAGRWHVFGRTGWCNSYVEALIAALEAAPEKANDPL